MDGKMLDSFMKMIGIVSFIMSLFLFFDYFVKQGQTNIMTQSEHNTTVLALIVLGIVTWVSFGLLWVIADQKIFAWDFGAGGSSALLNGFQATILSVSLTSGLILIPPLFQFLFGLRFIPDLHKHFLSGLAITITSTIGHVGLFGSNFLSYGGIRKLLSLSGTPLKLLRNRIFVELIYACVHFSTIVFVYRVSIEYPQFNIGVNFVRTIISSILYILGSCTFIFLLYPRSVTDSRWMEHRGMVEAFLLNICLIAGMFM